MPKYDVVFRTYAPAGGDAGKALVKRGARMNLINRSCWAEEQSGEERKAGLIALDGEFALHPNEISRLLRTREFKEVLEPFRQHGIEAEYSDSTLGPGVVVFRRGGFSSEEHRKALYTAFKRAYNFFKSRKST